MTENLTELIKRENALFQSCGGRIPEANSELNDLQRAKISAVRDRYGKAYIGCVNHYGDERVALTADTVFTEYNGQMVYNFGADYIVPVADRELAEMIVLWNGDGATKLPYLIKRITDRIETIGGHNLLWS
jgi:hypothetical protein